MAEVGDIVYWVVEETDEGGSLTKTPYPAVIVAMAHDDRASLWVFSPQQMFYLVDARCSRKKLARNRWMDTDDYWEARDAGDPSGEDR